MKLLLSGAATLTGAEVLRELLHQRHVDEILLLLPIDKDVRTRILQRLEAYLGPLPPSVLVVTGNLRLPRFGLSANAWERLSSAIDAGIHCAQRETKDHDLAEARQANVVPLNYWIELLEHNPLLRLHHLSTAFTAGTRRGLYTEFDLECGQSFHNAWERSKYEAEVRLRNSRVSDRVTIYRPSHTLGRSITGDAFHLGGAYPLLATLAAASVLPGDAKARIDFIPADYAGAAMATLASVSATGTFHLACGWHTSPTVKQTAALAAKGRGRAKGPMLVPRGVASPLRLGGSANPGLLSSRDLAFTTARDLLHQGPVFDTWLADRALAPLGISRPTPDHWLERVTRTAELRGWERPAAMEVNEQSPTPAQPAKSGEIAVAHDLK
jgi:thioester reductase-like protein